MSNTVESILSQLQQDAAGGQPSEKQARAQSPQSVESARGALDQVLSSYEQSQKTASSSRDSVEALQKMANDLAESDLQATIKEAHLFGASVFDGFIARANKYAEAAGAASQYQQKQANYAAYQQQLRQQQYNDAVYQQKLAAEQEIRGTIDGLTKLSEVSENCFVRGYNDIDAVINAINSQ